MNLKSTNASNFIHYLGAVVCFCLSQGRIFGLLVPTPKHRQSVAICV